MGGGGGKGGGGGQSTPDVAGAAQIQADSQREAIASKRNWPGSR